MRQGVQPGVNGCVSHQVPDRTVANQARGIQVLDVLNTNQGRDVGWMERAGALTGQDARVLVRVLDFLWINFGTPWIQARAGFDVSMLAMWAGRNVRQNPVRIVTLRSLYETAVRHKARMTGRTRRRPRLHHTLFSDDVARFGAGEHAVARNLLFERGGNVPATRTQPRQRIYNRGLPGQGFMAGTTMKPEGKRHVTTAADAVF
jgi:hypothetical protein